MTANSRGVSDPLVDNVIEVPTGCASRLGVCFVVRTAWSWHGSVHRHSTHRVRSLRSEAEKQTTERAFDRGGRLR